MQYTLVKQDGEQNVTVYITGRDPLMAHSTHPQWEEIVRRVLADDESVADLIDVAQAVEQRFRHLSERVTVRNGHIYLDGDEMDNGLTRQVLRFLNEDVEDWKPLIAFFEKVQSNPNDHSREQLYGFIERNEITITTEGDVVFYKGVAKEVDEETDETIYRPLNSGHGIVDGVEYLHDYLPQKIGSVVEMPRTHVRHDPSAACHVGLHAATYSFARSFATRTGVVLEIHVNPRDVVSVPNHADKIRCCRYKVIQEVEGAYEDPLLYSGPLTVSAPIQEILNDEEDHFPEDPEYDSDETGGLDPDQDPDVDGLPLPSKAAFTRMATLAKSQRKSIKAVATTNKFGWILVGEDQNDRESWRVPAGPST